MTELEMAEIVFDKSNEELFRLYVYIEAEMDRRGMDFFSLGDEVWD